MCRPLPAPTPDESVATIMARSTSPTLNLSRRLDKRLLDYLDEEESLCSMSSSGCASTRAPCWRDRSRGAVAEDWGDRFDLVPAFVSAYGTTQLDDDAGRGNVSVPG